MSKDNLPGEYHSEVTGAGVMVTFDCLETRHYLTGAQVTALIDDLSMKYMAWRGQQSKRGKQFAVLDRCVTGRPS